MGHIESWKNSKTLISQSAHDELESTEGKYLTQIQHKKWQSSVRSYVYLAKITSDKVHLIVHSVMVWRNK